MNYNTSLQEQANLLRREGVILERFDQMKEDGFHTGLWIEHNNKEYAIKMKNGEVMWIKEFDFNS